MIPVVGCCAKALSDHLIAPLRFAIVSSPMVRNSFETALSAALENRDAH